MRATFAMSIRDDGLYKVCGQPFQALVHYRTNQCELWHHIFAHFHYKALHIVSRMVIGIPRMQVDHEVLCQGCASGKNVKGPLSTSNNKSKEILHLIHSDLCGCMLVKSLGGYLYYAIFFDDCYIMRSFLMIALTWNFYLKMKD